MSLCKVPKKTIFLGAIILVFIIALIANPARYIQSVYGGLILFCVNVLPALFPFFFFSKALTAIGCVSIISQAFTRPARLLYNAPPCAAYIFIMSFLSGYPIGASLCSSLYEEGELTTDDVKSIMTFTSTSGPLFIVGTVAIGMFKSSKIGYIILFCHYIGAMLNGLIYRRKSTKIDPNRTEINSNQSRATSKATYGAPKQDLDNVLSSIAASSVQSILIVGAYIAIFSMIIDVLIDMRIIPFFTACLNLIGIPREIGAGILLSLVEITRGTMTLANANVSPVILTPIVCGLISFGGLAITMQSLSFLGKCKIKAPRYFLTKLTQAIISALICYPICLIFL